MGTVAQINTRRYHALLVASLKPPVQRYVFLSRVEEELIVDDRSYALGACQYPGAVASGVQYLDSFHTDPCATWTFAPDGCIMEKQVFLVDQKQAVVVRYRATRPIRLRLRMFLAFREYHSLTHQNSALNPNVGEESGCLVFRLYWGLPGLYVRHNGRFERDALWYNNIEYPRELDRGLDYREDLYTPGVLDLDLVPGEWNSICASIDGTDGGEPVPRSEPFVVRRSDGKSTIVAGYPWFTDWGRDTMISVPGLLIAPGRLTGAREIIEGFLATRSQGVIPNRFPDSGEKPEYNTVDATLWMFQAVRQWLAAGGDRSFLYDVFYSAAKEIIGWHRRGTWYGIGVDQVDRLLCAGEPGVALTWMDARVNGQPVTPRHGKPVEINALWHGALTLAAQWAEEMGDAASAEDFAKEAKAVRKSFGEKFWNAERACLYDVLASPQPDGALRPNQIFAVSLPFELLDRDQQKAVVRIVERELLTPVGLRTLDEGDPAYQPRYHGSPSERDAAYHQGTVWPWLTGPFIDAYLNAFGRTTQALEYCRKIVDRLIESTSAESCLGSIAEIYDGGEPRHAAGCPAQAWSVAEISRIKAAYGW